jgi:hypothetical protein
MPPARRREQPVGPPAQGLRRRRDTDDLVASSLQLFEGVYTEGADAVQEDSQRSSLPELAMLGPIRRVNETGAEGMTGPEIVGSKFREPTIRRSTDWRSEDWWKGRLSRRERTGLPAVSDAEARRESI